MKSFPEFSVEDIADIRKILRSALQTVVKTSPFPPFPDTLADCEKNALRETFGMFVTLKIDGNLRGCIGNIVSDRTLARSVWYLAYESAADDPRFDAVTAEELPFIDADITLLSEPRRIESYDDIIVGRHGVILRKGFRSAVFLPQVAVEQGWDLPIMLSHLALKAGLRFDAWKEDCRFDVFEGKILAFPKIAAEPFSD